VNVRPGKNEVSTKPIARLAGDNYLGRSH